MFSGYCGWDNSQELGKVLTQPHAGGSAEIKKKKKDSPGECNGLNKKQIEM